MSDRPPKRGMDGRVVDAFVPPWPSSLSIETSARVQSMLFSSQLVNKTVLPFNANCSPPPLPQLLLGNNKHLSGAFTALAFINLPRERALFFFCHLFRCPPSANGLQRACLSLPGRACIDNFRYAQRKSLTSVKPNRLAQAHTHTHLAAWRLSSH